MHLNRILVPIRTNSSRLPHLFISYKFSSTYPSFSTIKNSKTLTRTLLGDILKYDQKWSKQVLLCWYSSASNEELARKKHPDTFISVPTLHFEDASFEQPVSYDELCDELQICNSVEEQMYALTSALALSPEDVQKRINFSKLIESLLKPFFGDIKIQIFGSTVNGFGFKGCDIDMSFETFTDHKELDYLEPPDVPLVTEVMSGKVLPSDLALLPPKEQLLFIHSVLLEFYKESTEPTIFINAHVPLVRFYHDRYKLKCDLSCRNKIAFYNTKLLYLFGKLDQRVIPIMMTLRYWAKHVELIGKGLMFNTYTISLLVIHFLQTRNPPVLPTAEYILSLSDRLEIEDMNDTSFLEIRKHVPPSNNTQTLDELLRDFFFYYLYFDFTRVICPLIGGSVPREEFFTSQTSKKFRMHTICVQDPMLVTHNVAELVDYKHCKKLVSELLRVCNIFQDNLNLTPSSSKWGLLNLFEKVDEHHLFNASTQKNVSFTIPIIKKPMADASEVKDTKLMTAETLLHLFNHVLLFDCKPIETSELLQMLKKHDDLIQRQRKSLEDTARLLSEVGLYRKNKKKQLHAEKQNIPETLMLQDFQRFNAEHKLILCAECKVTKNTWLGRDFVSVESFSKKLSNNLIEKEHYISINAAKQNEQNSLYGKTKPFTFFYECYLSPKVPESSLLVNFRPFQRNNFNPILGIFLKKYIPNIMKDLNEDSC